MKPFYQLTNTGRARRLRQMALKVLEQYDLETTHLHLLTNGYNAIFRVDTADRARYVVRIMRPGERTDGQIMSQAIWLDELAHHGVNVSYPLPNRDGTLVTRAEVPGVPEVRQSMVCAWVPGVSLGHCFSLPNVEKQGVLLARMHTLAAAYRLPADFQVKVYDRLYPYAEPWVLHDPACIMELDEMVRLQLPGMISHVEAALAHLRESRAAMQLLHGDLHLWNVLVTDDVVYAIDFDDLLLGYPVQDIGITLFYYRRREDYADILAAFRRGYESVIPWPEQYAGEVETWITGRALNLLNTVLWSQDPEDRQYIQYCVAHLMTSWEGLKAFAVPTG